MTPSKSLSSLRMTRSSLILVFAICGLTTTIITQAQNIRSENINLQQSKITKSVNDWWEPDTVYIFTVDSELLFRISYNYGGNNNMLTELWESPQSGNWVNRLNFTYSYYENNNIRTKLYETWQNDDWVNTLKYTYGYDEKNNIRTELSENLQNGNWVNYEKYTCSYDGNNNMLTELYESWQSGDWVKNKEYTYDYDENNNIILTKLYEPWQGDWINSGKITCSYDENNNVMTKFVESWQDGGLVNYRKAAYSYDGNNMTELWEYWQNGDWVIRVKQTHTYDKNNNKLTFLSQNRQNDGWVNSFQFLWTYDENDNCVFKELLNWKDGRWQPFQASSDFYYNNMQSSHTYFGYKVTATYVKFNHVGIADILQNNKFLVYPNPTQNSFFIEFKNVSTVKLYDMLGKEVLTQNANGKTEINISHLSQGIYNVKVFSDGKTIGNSKIVKQ